MEDAERLFEAIQETLQNALKGIDLEEASRIRESMKQERMEKYKNTLRFMPQDTVGKIKFLAKLSFLIFSVMTRTSAMTRILFSPTFYTMNLNQQ